MARHGLLLVRALLLVAAAASAMLVADYAAEQPAFCAEGGGCEAVQASEYSSPLGIPLPFAGLAGFSALYLLSLSRRPAARALLRASLLAAGAIGAALVALQARVIGAFCPLCLTVDGAAIAAGLLALASPVFRAESAERLTPFASLALLLLALGSPLGWRAVAPRAPSPAATAFFAREGVQVVEVADFTCPHCRALYPRLEAAVRAQDPPVAVHRLMVPVTGHPRSVEAASAYVCADRAGVGDAMAAILFTDAGLRMPAPEWARGAGMEAEALAECMTSESTARALDANRRAAESLAIRGIPTTFIGSDVLVGAVPTDRIERALDALEGPGRKAAIPALAYAAAVIALALAIVAFGRNRARPRD